MSDADKKLLDEMYQALQGVSGCPGKCKCCPEHEAAVRAALAAFLNRWRQEARQQ